MLANTPRSETTFARDGRCEIRLAVGTKCPHCGRQLHAHDVKTDFGNAKLVCAGCHRDVLTIGGAV
jgi:hypothetical protein